MRTQVDRRQQHADHILIRFGFMQELLLQFVQDPNAENFLALRNSLIESERYDPYSDEMTLVDSLIESEKWSEAQEALGTAMPNLILSPRAHLMMSFIAEKLDQEMAQKMEGFLASACCQGIVETGDGTKESPYLVTRTSDEYDVLSYLQKEFVEQSLVHVDEKSFDVVKCSDGTELWFDISVCFGKLKDKFDG